MPRVAWTTLASRLLRRFVIENGRTLRCTICNREIRPEKNTLASRLAAVYRHFKELHPDVIDKLRGEILEVKTSTSRIDQWLE